MLFSGTSGFILRSAERAVFTGSTWWVGATGLTGGGTSVFSGSGGGGGADSGSEGGTGAVFRFSEDGSGFTLCDTK